MRTTIDRAGRVVIPKAVKDVFTRPRSAARTQASVVIVTDPDVVDSRTWNDSYTLPSSVATFSRATTSTRIELPPPSVYAQKSPAVHEGPFWAAAARGAPARTTPSARRSANPTTRYLGGARIRVAFGRADAGLLILYLTERLSNALFRPS